MNKRLDAIEIVIDVFNEAMAIQDLYLRKSKFKEYSRYRSNKKWYKVDEKKYSIFEKYKAGYWRREKAFLIN